MSGMSTGPLRVTADQWADISEHYDQGEPDTPRCSVCDCELDRYEAEFDICDDCHEAEEGVRPEPIPDDVMQDDYLRAVDEIAGLYPRPDDHDQRYDDFYSTQQGDIGDQEIPY